MKLKYSLSIISSLLLIIILLMYTPPTNISLNEDNIQLESLTFEKTIFEPGSITIELVNGGPSTIKLSQIIINDAIWGGYITPSEEIPRLGKAKLSIPFDWIKGEPVHIVLISSKSIKFEHVIDNPVITPIISIKHLSNFIMLGIYVGIIPVFLGLLWLPFFSKINSRKYNFLLSLTIGLLLFLGFNSIVEAIDLMESVPLAFQSSTLFIFSILISFLVLQMLTGKNIVTLNKEKPFLRISYMIALGIGLHNLSEGLAIGSAYSLANIALGTFLVIGFTIHNVTEGVAIISPISTRKFKFKNLIFLGIIGGGPTIIGVIVGGFAYTTFWAIIFLGIGIGAIFQVVYEILKSINHDKIFKNWINPTNVLGLTIGALIMYLTGLLIAV